MMRCSNEYNGAIVGDVKGSSRSYLPEEDIGDCPPKQQGSVIGEIGGCEPFFGSGWHAFVSVR